MFEVWRKYKYYFIIILLLEFASERLKLHWYVTNGKHGVFFCLIVYYATS